jgi:hypothetical protein
MASIARAMSNDQRLGLGEAVTAEAIGLLRFSFTSLNAGSTCAISARCSTTRGPCPIRHAIKCRSVAGSSAQHRQVAGRRDGDIAAFKFARATMPREADVRTHSALAGNVFRCSR